MNLILSIHIIILFDNPGSGFGNTCLEIALTCDVFSSELKPLFFKI